MPQSIVQPTISRSVVAQLVKDFLNPPTEKRDRTIQRVINIIHDIANAPLESVGIDDPRFNYSDEFKQLKQSSADARKLFERLVKLADKNVEILRLHGFDEEQLDQLVCGVADFSQAADVARWSLPGARGGDKVDFKEYVCADCCIALFAEFRSNDCYPENNDLKEFAQEIYRLAEASGNADMRGPIENMWLLIHGKK